MSMPTSETSSHLDDPIAAWRHWTRVDPRSTLPIAGPVVVVLIVLWLQQFAPTSGTAGDVAEAFVEDWTGLVLAAAFAAGAAARYLSTRFRIADGVVQWRTGILTHQAKELGLDRIQDVTITRPLVARVLGLSRVTISSAGSDGEILLEYLSVEGAEVLTTALVGALRLRGAGDGVAEGQGSQGVTAEGRGGAESVRELHRVDPGELAGAVWNRSWPWVFGAVIGLVVCVTAGVVAQAWQSLVPLIAMSLVGVVSVVGWTLNHARLTVVLESGETVRATAGVATIHRSSSRLRRIQVVYGESGWMQRLRSRESVWYASADATLDADGAAVRGRLALDMPTGTWAGFAHDLIGLPIESLSRLVQKPRAARFAVFARVASIATPVLAALGIALAVLVVGQRRSEWSTGLSSAPLVWGWLAMVLAAIAFGVYRGWRLWRVERWGLSETHLVVVRGLLRRRVLAASVFNTQSVRVISGPIQRRLGLASVQVSLAPPDVSMSPLIADIEVAEAHDLARRLISFCDNEWS